MQILGGSQSIPPGSGPYALGIGIFDGVHLGHQVLLRRVLTLAHAEGLPSLAYTFNPHPARVLNPTHAPQLIEPVEKRLERIGTLGFEAALVEPFNRELAAMPAEQFVSDILVARLRARHVVVGKDFTFGHERRGNVELLRQLGGAAGFEVHAIPLLRFEGRVVTSSEIRKAVAAGDMRTAAQLLGRPFALEGMVRRGDQRGTKLGFPTANVETHNELVPMTGVYACRVGGPFEARPAVVNLGYSPTFGGSKLKIEAHVLDFPHQPLYGLVLSIDFIEKLRDEQRFDDVEALKAQIARDVARGREVLRAT